MSRKASRTPAPVSTIPQLAPRLLNVSEAARYLGVRVWTLRTLTWNKQLAPVRIGESRRLLYDRADLDQFVEKQKKAAA